jgi:hypothetical protein
VQRVLQMMQLKRYSSVRLYNSQVSSTQKHMSRVVQWLHFCTRLPGSTRRVTNMYGIDA